MMLVYLITHIIEAFCFFYYFHNTYKCKYNRGVEITSILVVHIILLYLFESSDMYIKGVCISFSYIILCMFLYEITMKNAVFNSILLCVTMASTEFIPYIIMSFLVENMAGMEFDLNGLILFMVISKFMYFVFIYTYMVIKKQDGLKENNYVNVCIIMVTITSLFVMVAFLTLYYNNVIGYEDGIYMSVCSIMLLFSNVFLILFNNDLNVRMVEHYQLLIEYHKEHAELEQMQLKNQSYENINIIKHDITNHLMTVKKLSRENKREELLQYIDELIDDVKQEQYNTYCNVDALNIMLNEYMNKCREADMECFYDIRTKEIEGMEQSNIVSLFGNLLSNAYNAAVGASRNKSISLSIVKVNENVVIKLVNTCDSKPLVDKNGNFVSPKESEGHGFGLKSIKKIVKKYNGEIKQYYSEEDCTFHTVILVRI